MIKQKDIVIKTASATLTYTEMGDIVCNSASATTITLPAPNSGLWYRISNVGPGVVTVEHDATELTTLKQTEQCLCLANGTSSWFFSKGGGAMTKAEIENVLTGEISSHTHKFIDLSDTQNDYVADKFIKVNAEGDGLEYGDGGGLAEIPQATESALGGIKAKAKTTESSEVAIDTSTGKLYTLAPDEAANGLPTGGTAGQILSKIDGTDYNAEWVDAPTGSVPATPTGDGTEDTYTGTLTNSGSLYSGVCPFIKMKTGIWLLKIKIKIDTNCNITVNIRNYGAGIIGRKADVAATGGIYNTITLDEPVYLEPNTYYYFEFLFSVKQKTARAASYKYNGTLWELIETKVNNYIGAAYSETPGLGLIEYNG